VTVYLVGAGPGDPGLITVRGAEVLARADCIVYDRLASRSLLDLAPGDAELISAGKAPGAVERSQNEINALLVEHGRLGETVVRLKGGDPFVFGRGGEEAEALAAAGVAFEVVPGITSAIGAPTYAGIPVTHRGVSTHFTVVTGHEDPSKAGSDVDWAALARAGGTLVILMGAQRIAEIASQLRAGGLRDDTPVAAVRNGTRPDEETLRTTLGALDDATITAPSAIVVGDVAALDLGWFERRPLFGRSIVVTRAREQASDLRRRLLELGADVVELPTIAVEARGDVTVPALEDFGWVVFTSSNGVRAFFAALRDAGRDARALARSRVAAIGPGTADALDVHGIGADVVPARFVAESLVDAFPEPVVPDERVLVAQAEHARDVLRDGLITRGYDVSVLPVYRTVVAEPDPAHLAQVRAGEVDAITFTSSSTVANFLDVLGAVPEPQPRVISIGPITSATLRDRGVRVDGEAAESTIEGLVASVLECFAD